MTRRIAAFSLALTLLLPAAGPPPPLTQGWTIEEQQTWWNSPQGSRIVPYEWFLKLNTADGSALFADPAHLARYGYLPAPASALNPDALPIGFSREADRSGSPWLGMTCSACHTGALHYQGKTMLLEGVGGMVDTQSFDRDLSAALTATAADDQAFAGFADRLGAPDRAALREQLRAVAAMRAVFTTMNTPPHDHGPGRVDALGVIMNALTVTALGKPENARAPDAPVRLPWVWNSTTYSRVQYNGSISNAGLGPLLRNLGQTLGVYGTVDLSKPPVAGYPSSVAIADLDRLEALLTKLEPPAWPADMLPPIDTARAAEGATIFASACASCHQAGARDANGLIPVALVPLDKIGTDPKAARNFMTRPADTGELEGRPIAVFGGPAVGPRAGAATIVGHVSTGVAMQLPRDRLQAGLGAYRAAIAANPGRLDAYKAIPLAGVWAGAPYLHNGSVANLQQLLTPPGERATRFSVGAQDYDPVSVGFKAAVSGNGYALDTTLPGNANTGHDYGTTLTDAEKASLIEYLKTL
jgi:mono/diheme cytochrome c family protein